MRIFLTACAVAVVAGLAPAQADFVNFETALVHPIRISPDGRRLFVLNTPDARLNVYSLADPDAPLLLREIPVGQEPVSVTPRTSDEVWVVNNLSDTVSIVSVSRGRVVATLRVKDEPADVVFAGTPEKAFVSVAASDEVRVFDADSLAPLGSVPVFGKDPRALVANAAGDRVYALVHRSGNRTTIVPEHLAPMPPMPTNPLLPPAPQTSLIVSLDDPNNNFNAVDLPDHDVVEIDVSSLAVTRTFAGIGTINFDMALDAASGDLLVVNTEARNHIRFEPNLRAHVIDSRIVRLDVGNPGGVTIHDLNPGARYSALPSTPSRALALSEPSAVAVHPGGAPIYVAAQGADRIGVLNAAGQVTARIELGTAPAAAVDTLGKRGPRGLALLPAASRLYVHNRLSHTFSIIDTASGQVVAEHSIGFDPTPARVRNGRKFLYDARLSGNGSMSCAACHVDGDLDLLAWDLGDPGGELQPVPAQLPHPVFPPLPLPPTDFHPMKGPMVTQTLRGLADNPPYHWRGDRSELADFNGAFDSLMGGARLSDSDMQLYADFMLSIAHPPNPLQNLDRSFADTPAGASPERGREAFFDEPALGLGNGRSASCGDCHNAVDGSNPFIFVPDPNSNFVIFQAMSTPTLRGLYRRGAIESPQSKVGFGFLNDGKVPSLLAFVSLPLFNQVPVHLRDDIAAFVASFDTGTAPAVGHQVTLDADTAADPSVAAELFLLEGQAMAGNADLIARGEVDGLPRAFLYDPSTSLYTADDPSVGPFLLVTLAARAAAGDVDLVFTGVAPGSGRRQALDRDRDGTTDGVDGLRTYGKPVAGSRGPALLTANREPRVDTADFAFVSTALAPGATGALVASTAPADGMFMGLPVYVDSVTSPFVITGVTADVLGTLAVRSPIPDNPLLAGVTVYLQGLFTDPGAPGNSVATNGLEVVIQPRP